MRVLVREPQRHELGIETETVGLLIRDAGEVLEADERDSATADHELAGVCRTDADHEHDIDVDVGRQDRRATLLGIARESNDIAAFQHPAQIAAIGVDRRVYNILKMRAVRIDDVIRPVRLEEAAVRGEVAFVGGGSVGASENGKEIRQQIDQHLDQSAGRRRGGTMDAE